MRKDIIAFLIFIDIIIISPGDLIELANGNSPIVSTSLGQYQGLVIISRLGKEIFSFKGIPYALPPINDLRFKPPVPVEKHEDIFIADADSPVCPQPTMDIVSEDCLKLNVYTTKIPTEDDHPRRPVIVYIHSGGLYSLSGGSNWAGPEYLMDQEIVLVTMNYRLGSLGFLSTGDKESPGNNGLKDQTLALKWVNQNIEAFGGDKDSVTLFGHGAGAICATLHLVSPMSEGLFHKVIVSSGSSLGQWPIRTDQLFLAKTQANLLDCPNDTSVNIINCLKEKSPHELGESLPDFAEFGDEPMIIWTPVMEEDFGQERFLVDHPIRLVNEGKFTKVPILMGTTADEFLGKANDLIRNASQLKELDENWLEYAPITFLYERNTTNSNRISNSLRKFYFGDKKLDNSSLPQLVQIYSDALVGFGVNRGVKLLSEKQTQPVYYYKFNYKGRYSHYNLPEFDYPMPYGVAHHDDLIYLFYISELFPKFGEADPESPTINKMTKLWANFAKTGKPVIEKEEELDHVDWIPYDMTDQKYLEIGNKLVLKDKLYSDRYAEWEKLFPILVQ